MAIRQETFNTVVTHLRNQGCKSQDDKQCMYRGPNGTKCAAGCLIPDSKYDPSFENSQVTESRIATVIRSEGHDLFLVRELQKIHDNVPTQGWEYRLAAIAISFRLTMPEGEE